jgi:hypothetical protein
MDDITLSPDKIEFRSREINLRTPEVAFGVWERMGVSETHNHNSN